METFWFVRIPGHKALIVELLIEENVQDIPLELKPAQEMKLLTVHTYKVDPELAGCDSLETEGKLKSDLVIWADYTVLFNWLASYIFV